MNTDRLAEIEADARAADFMEFGEFRPADVLALVEIARAARGFVDTADRAPVKLAPSQAIPWDDLCRALARLDSGAAE